MARAVGLAAALALAGCNYGFEGGGFPSHIRTIYIEPFDNQTAQFDIEQRLFSRLIEDLPRQLGVRPAGREAADAILRGRITRYDDVAQSVRPGAVPTTAGVLVHDVAITIAAELIDVRQNVIRWESGGLTGRGTYRPDSESDEVGQAAAIRNLLDQIIDGAQSQW